MESGMIQKAWVALAKKLKLPPDSIQCVEMRQAFFAGAYTVMGFLKLMGDDHTTDEDVKAKVLEGIWKEVDAFRMEVTYDPEQN